MAEGVELANHWTHSAPCSPSRATMMTGRYLPGHQVYDNTVFKWHKSLDPAIPTVGSQLGSRGLPLVATSASGTSPAAPRRPMDLYGYADWDGNDQHFMGWAGTGRALRPGDRRLRRPLARRQRRPGRSVVPHGRAGEPARRDVVPDGPARLPGRPPRRAGGDRGAPRRASKWKDGNAVPPFTDDYPDVVDRLPGELRRRPADEAGVPPPVALGPAALARRLPAAGGPRAVAAPARLLREAPPARRRQPRHGARRPRAQRRLGRHRGRLHLRPRRHVRIARPALEGARSSTTRSCGCRAT